MSLSQVTAAALLVALTYAPLFALSHLASSLRLVGRLPDRTRFPQFQRLLGHVPAGDM